MLLIFLNNNNLYSFKIDSDTRLLRHLTKYWSFHHVLLPIVFGVSSFIGDQAM